MADLALNHRLAQGALSGIVRGFNTIDLKEGLLKKGSTSHRKDYGHLPHLPIATLCPPTVIQPPPPAGSTDAA